MRNIVAALTGGLMAAQASLIAKWPSDAREWTMFTLTTLIGLGGGFMGKQANSAIRKSAAKKEQE